jgi:hypothetical protein
MEHISRKSSTLSMLYTRRHQLLLLWYSLRFHSRRPAASQASSSTIYRYWLRDSSIDWNWNFLQRALKSNRRTTLPSQTRMTSSSLRMLTQTWREIIVPHELKTLTFIISLVLHVCWFLQSRFRKRQREIHSKSNQLFYPKSSPSDAKRMVGVKWPTEWDMMIWGGKWEM